MVGSISRARSRNFSRPSPASRRPNISGSVAPTAASPPMKFAACFPAKSSSIATSPTSSSTATSIASPSCSTPSMSSRVKHILIVGHYGCGGVRAASSSKKFGLIDNWLRHVQDVNEIHRPPRLLSRRVGPDRPPLRTQRHRAGPQRRADHHRPERLGTRPGPRHPRLGLRLKDGLVRNLGISLASANELAAAMKTPWDKSQASLQNPERIKSSPPLLVAAHALDIRAPAVDPSCSGIGFGAVSSAGVGVVSAVSVLAQPICTAATAMRINHLQSLSVILVFKKLNCDRNAIDLLTYAQQNLASAACSRSQALFDRR